MDFAANAKAGSLEKSLAVNSPKKELGDPCHNYLFTATLFLE
jgi:hypothetical protein